MRSINPPRSRLLAALTGILLAAGTPPFNIFPFAWIGLIPIIADLERPEKNGFGEGFIGGLVFNKLVMHWLAFNSGTIPAIAIATMVATTAILTIGWAFAAWIYVYLRRTFGKAVWFLLPFSWTAWEGWLTCLGEI